MANTVLSPNMNLPVPTVSEDPGPDWATNVNACLSILDGHSHTSGSGVPINPSAININTDLTFNGFNGIDYRSIRFTPQLSPLAGATDLGCLYEAGVDLYYNDGNGNQVRITQSGSLAGAAGTITGLPSGTASAAFAGNTFTFLSATSTPATISGGPLVISRNTASPKTVTVSGASGQAADYNLTLPPALPGASSLLTVDNTGVMGATVSPTLNGATITSSVISSTDISGGAMDDTTVTNCTIDNSPIGGVTPNSGIFSQLTIGTSGSAFKTRRFTGSITASGSATLMAASSYTSFFGIIGSVTFAGSLSNWYTVGGLQTPVGGNSSIYFFKDGTGNTGAIKLINGDSTHTNNYDVTVFYI